MAIRIRWRDMDAYGHVNNAVYLTYLEECRDRWVRSVLGDAAFVIVRIAIDYRRELSLADEEIVVRCRGHRGRNLVDPHGRADRGEGRLGGRRVGIGRGVPRSRDPDLGAR